MECVSGNPNHRNLTLEGASGTFHGPRYIPAPVPSSPTCIWVITVPDGKVVQLRFEPDNCLFFSDDDYVEIRDGRYSTSELMGKRHKIDSFPITEDICSSGRYLRIEYTSFGNKILKKRAFKARFEAVDKPSKYWELQTRCQHTNKHST